MDVFDLYAKVGLDSSAYDSGVKKVESDGKKLLEKLSMDAKIDADEKSYKSKVKSAEKTADSSEKKLSFAAKLDLALTNFENKIGKAKDIAEKAKKAIASATKLDVATEAFKKKINSAKDALDVIKKHASAAGIKLEIDTTKFHEKLEAAKNAAKNAASTIGKGLKVAFGAIGTAVAGAATGIAALGKQSIEAYAEYEQLVGGVETLFGASADKVKAYADNAYKTAGLSANAYMSTVTSFSASLLQGLGGDTAKAYEIANQAVIDMSDNANKMGTDMQMIRDAYQGFAKDNFDMLDNLKLGYGGTASEMARLINDTGVMGTAFQATAENVKDVPFDKMIEAIHQVQTEMGITGTTSKEASTTIQGSVNMMKSAWTNFVTGLADPNQDFDALLGNLVDSVVTVGDNLIPRIEMLLPRLVDGITQLATSLTEHITSVIETLLPALITGAITLINSLAAALPGILTSLVGAIASPETVASLITVVTTLFNSILTMLPQIAKLGLTLLVSLVQGFADNIGSVIDTVVDVVIQLAMILTEPSTLTSLIEAGVELLVALIDGLAKAIPQLISYVPTIISNIWDTIQKVDWGELGKNILTGLVNGLKNSISAVTDAVKEIAGKISQKFKDFFGIASPSKLFKAFGGYLDEGLAIGITGSIQKPLQATQKLSDSVSDALSVDYTTPAAQPVRGTGASALAQSIAQEVKVIVGFDLDGMGFARGLNPYLKRVSKEVGA